MLREAAKSVLETKKFNAGNRKGLRICFISSYPPNHARLSEYAQSLVTELARRPAIDQLIVLADKAANSDKKVSENPKIKIMRVWKHDDPLSILSVFNHILKLKPDVVHFSIGFQSYGKTRISNFLGISLISLCRLCNIKVIVLLHNLAEIIDLEKIKKKPTFANKTGILVATKLILSASRVIVMVRSYANYLKQHYKINKVLFIPHGSTGEKCISLDPEEKVILTFGHMGPSKGLPIMLNAFQKIIKERSDVQLVIAGADHPDFPGYLEKFRKSASPKVVFTGYVPEKDLCQVFGAADVVVTPYLIATGTSGVFHLACGFGKPVVSSDLPEMRELLDYGASAILIPPGDDDALKDAILKVLDNKEATKKMCEQNLKFAQRERWSTVAKIYEETYLKLLSS